MIQRPLPRTPTSSPSAATGTMPLAGWCSTACTTSRTFRYFDAHQRATLEALCARVIPQAHRPPRSAGADRALDRPALLPATPSRASASTTCLRTSVAWDWGLEGLDQTAQALLRRRLRRAGRRRGRTQVLEAIRAGDPPGEVWQRLPARRWWIYVALRQITGVYYAHPYAWDEIGFGGPAYPRGYFALELTARPEPWEAREAPPDARGSAAMKLHVHLSSDWVLDTEMREYPASEEVDFCIIGTGAGGGVLAQRLARYGFSVVALEAGAWHDTEHDMVSDEAGSARLYWNDLRITGGTEPAGARREQLRPGRRRQHHPLRRRSARASTRPTSACARSTAWPPTGRSPTTSSSRTTRRWSGSTPSPARPATRGASRTATRTRRSRRARPARS